MSLRLEVRFGASCRQPLQPLLSRIGWRGKRKNNFMNDFKNKLKFDQNGLIPAIAQDATSGEVLMMAWMNLESLQLTITSGYATYFSRSRNSLWKKGDTSGHLQKIVSIKADCDFDCILMSVNQVGAACHTGARSCFFNEIL